MKSQLLTNTTYSQSLYCLQDWSVIYTWSEIMHSCQWKLAVPHSFTQHPNIWSIHFFLLREWAQLSAWASLWFPGFLVSLFPSLSWVKPTGHTAPLWAPQTKWAPPVRKVQSGLKHGLHPLGHSVRDINQAAWQSWGDNLVDVKSFYFIDGHSSAEGTKKIQKHWGHFVDFTIWL